MKQRSFKDLLEARRRLGKQRVAEGHFPECYMVAHPDDPEVYCTCMSAVPD